MIFLDAIVQNGDYNVLAREAQTPGARDVHCTAVFILIMLRDTRPSSEPQGRARTHHVPLLFPLGIIERRWLR